MNLEQQVGQAFSSDGVLARHNPGFQPREAQTDMALAVAEVIDSGGALVAEAGTGVGKTFSYLVPALLSGLTVLVSTATKTLQDQLYSRDLPGLIKAFGLPVRLALLKGRGSYLCLHRMHNAQQEGVAQDAQAGRALDQVVRWAQATATGDLAEIPDLDERSPVIPLVTSTRDNCLGTPCPQHRACHVNRARREAMTADLVVVNHHLFFADMGVRESGVAELLPSVRVAIFDEAHQLNEIGVQFLGAHLSTSQLLDLCRDMLATGLQQARGLADWSAAASAVDRGSRNLRLAAGHRASGKLRWTGSAPEGVDPEPWDAALQSLAEALTLAAGALDTVSELGPDFVRLRERVQVFATRVEQFRRPCAPGCVRWAETGMALRLTESPLDIADAMQSVWQGAKEPVNDNANDNANAAGPSAWVFTSATLGDDAQLRWFTEPCGLGHARIARFGSPFNYAEQAALYVPKTMAKPSDAAHPVQVAQLTAGAARRLGGRTMVLTTTLRALRQIGGLLREDFQAHGGPEVLVQGEMPKRRLMERFRAAAAPGVTGCVMVASASFWEGVDLPGDALQLVVIDKLPFPPPGDPLVEARSQRLEAEGRSPFNDYFVPEAAVMLKQGAGRLIRTLSDSGVLVVCDPRLATMGYGRRLLAALPPMRRLANAVELDAALDALRTASTTDSCWP